MMSPNVQPDTRLNWTAIAELARPRALAEPMFRAISDLLHHTRDPKTRLWFLLDLWVSMDEETWPQANVRAMLEDILDVFRDHPEAEAWYRQWRAAHPEAKLA